MAQNHPDRGQRGLPGGAPRYSAFALAKKAMNYHQDWQRAWRDPEPKAEYDAVIIGGGGHGLATGLLSRSGSWPDQYCGD
jgi:sarcosine oxidase subunit beta